MTTRKSATAHCKLSNPFKSKGFTLIELLVVVLIIGILAAIALPQYTKAVERSRAMDAVVNVKAWAESMERYYLANNEYPFLATCGVAIPDDSNAFKILDIDVPNLEGYARLGCNVYVMYKRTSGTRIAISQTLKHQPAEVWAKRGLTCNIPFGENPTTSAAAKICKSICGAEELVKVWGSGEYGCAIDAQTTPLG